MRTKTVRQALYGKVMWKIEILKDCLINFEWENGVFVFYMVQCVRSLTWQASVAWSVKNENRNSSYIKGSNEGRHAQHRAWNIINSQELLSLLWLLYLFSHQFPSLSWFPSRWQPYHTHLCPSSGQQNTCHQEEMQ